MTKRFLVYIAVFNGLAAIAAIPGFALVCTWSLGTRLKLMKVLSPVAAPPLMLTSLFAWSLAAVGVPPSLLSPIMAPIGCFAYYALLFVLFLPVGLRRKRSWRTWKRRRGVLWRAWLTLVVVVMLAHVILVIYGLALLP